MNLKNVKAVKLCGIKYDVERVVNVDKLHGNNDGYFTTAGKIYVKAGLNADRESAVIWHEISHLIDFGFLIKNDGADLAENEVQRLSTALQGLEIECDEAQPKENYSTWYLLGERRPAEGAVCIIMYGDFQYARYDTFEDCLILENKEKLYKKWIPWTPFTQELYNKLFPEKKENSPWLDSINNKMEKAIRDKMEAERK